MDMLPLDAFNETNVQAINDLSIFKDESIRQFTATPHQNRMLPVGSTNVESVYRRIENLECIIQEKGQGLVIKETKINKLQHMNTLLRDKLQVVQEQNEQNVKTAEEEITKLLTTVAQLKKVKLRKRG
eukprot:GHVL01038565.1.p2 GENE.GHVL01038565.1~~GHVL01038565.1.p2  ORF type:complete len:128 (+),score=25.71 GHVL01038565.1:190-573(+)